MNYADIELLYSEKKNPALTIKMNVNEGTNPNSDHDRITLKNMVEAAQSRLLEEYKPREIEQLLENLHETAHAVTLNIHNRGLVLFVAKDTAKYALLPFPVGNKIKIGRHFATRTLIRAYNQIEHYFILAVSQSEVRLIECYNNSLVQEHTQGFPVKNDEYYNTDRLKKSFASAQDKIIQKFLRDVDSRLQPIYAACPLPIVVAGPEEAIANYTKIAGDTRQIIGKVRGNFDTFDGAQLNKLINSAYKVVQAYKTKKTDASFADMDQALSRGLLEYDINKIYQYAQNGQVAELLVDQDYYVKAIKDEHTGLLHFGTKKSGTQLDDAVNHIIHHVKATSGDVVFLPPYSIDSSRRMAAILRWR